MADDLMYRGVSTRELRAITSLVSCMTLATDHPQVRTNTAAMDYPVRPGKPRRLESNEGIPSTYSAERQNLAIARIRCAPLPFSRSLIIA